MFFGFGLCELKMVFILIFLFLNLKNDVKNIVFLKIVLRLYKFLRLMYVS